MYTNFYFILTFIFCLITSYNKAQINFIQDNSIPVITNLEELTNPWAGGLNFGQFSEIDLNLDGEKDLFIFDRSGRNGTKNGNKILPFIFDNINNKYIYSPEYVDQFPAMSDWTLLVDYNLDGKEDIFTSKDASIDVYTNNSDNELSFEFHKTLTSDAGFGPINLYVSSADIPAINDIDSDGDIDILTFDPAGSHVYWHENKSIELYGHSDSINLVRSDNCWGKFQEEFSTNSVILNLDENCNTLTQRFSNRHSGSTLLAIDLDPKNNQGKELLLGDLTYNNMVMLINGGTPDEAYIINQDVNFPNYNQPINITKFPGAFYLDLNKDQLKDLIISPNGVNVSQNVNNCHFYKNNGPNNKQNMIEFEYVQNDFLVNSMIDVGANSHPILFDLNNDNLPELIVSNKGYFNDGNYDSKISLYKNSGTISNPIFELITNDFSNLFNLLGSLPSIQAIHPTFGDLNNDGLIDMIIGDNNGELYYFENGGLKDGGWPYFSTYEMLNIDVGSFATPQLIDLNRDGLLDLIIGERMGVDNGILNGINYFQNTGSLTNPQFTDFTPEFPSGTFDDNNIEITIKSLGGVYLGDPIYLTAYTSPYIFEHNNLYYLAVGTEEGLIYLYKDVEIINQKTTNLVLNLDTPFNLVQNNILNINNCIHSKVAILDINNDNKLDLFRGNANGGIELFIGEEFNTQTQHSEQKPTIEIYPNPTSDVVHIKGISQYNNITIYSITGKIILEYENYSKNHININDLINGIYFLVIENNNNVEVKELIIQK